METGSTIQPSHFSTRHEQLIDVLGAAVWTAGISALLFDFRSYEVPFWQVAVLAITMVSLIALLRRRWWLAPVILAGLFLAALLIIWRLGNEEQIIKGWQMIVSWYQEFFDLTQLMPEPHLAVTAGLILPVAIILYAIVSMVDSIWIYLGLSVALLGPILLVNSGSMPLYLVVLAAFFIQVPRFVAREIRRKRPRDAGMPRFAMQWLAVPVVVTCLLMANWLVPEQTLSWRFAPLANWVQDWEDLWQNTMGPGRSQAPFNLAYYGYGNTSARLGGPVIQNEANILHVTADRRGILKGSTRTIYTGHSWQRAAMPSYRLASPLWRSQRRRVFADPLSQSPAGRRFSQTWSQAETLSITDLQRQTTLFSAGKVQDLEVTNRLVFAPYFTPDGDLFTYAVQPELFAYTVKTSLINRRQAGFDQAALAAEQDLADEAKDDANWRNALAGNLQLPAELPDIVRSTAVEVTAQAKNPYAKALLLEQFLKDRGTYTLQPAMPPQDVDFVAYFLDTREGHCVYYATAMAVMARTLGIPARYVEGFTMDDGSKAGEYRVTGKNAHAWAELYFKGLGWLVFDPTPAAPVRGAALPDEPEPTPAIPAAESATDTLTPEEKGPMSAKVLLYGLLLLVLPILAGQLAYRLALYRHRLTFEPTRISRRYADPGHCLEFYYQDVLRQLACLDLAPETGETLPQFARRAESYVQVDGHSLPEVLWPVSCLHYGDKQPSPKDLSKLAELRAALETRLKANLQPMKYFFKRVLAWPAQGQEP